MTTIQDALDEIDSIFGESTHMCEAGRKQLGCRNPCTISADPDVREVFHKCINGGIKRLGVDTAVFYPITDSTFDNTTAIDDVVGERLFAALGIATPDDDEIIIGHEPATKCDQSGNCDHANECAHARGHVTGLQGGKMHYISDGGLIVVIENSHDTCCGCSHNRDGVLARCVPVPQPTPFLEGKQ